MRSRSTFYCICNIPFLKLDGEFMDVHFIAMLYNLLNILCVLLYVKIL